VCSRHALLAFSNVKIVDANRPNFVAIITTIAAMEATRKDAVPTVVHRINGIVPQADIVSMKLNYATVKTIVTTALMKGIAATYCVTRWRAIFNARVRRTEASAIVPKGTGLRFEIGKRAKMPMNVPNLVIAINYAKI